MDRQKVRTLPQEEQTTKFTQADLSLLGKLSVNLGMLHWQNEDIGEWGNQVSILLKQQELLNDLVASLLFREL